jgi:hypothetical protein
VEQREASPGMMAYLVMNFKYIKKRVHYRIDVKA